MTSEFERMVNLANRLPALARTVDSNVAVVQQTREEVLLDVNAFNLVHVHFDGASVHEPSLVDHPPIGHGDFYRPPAPPSRPDQIQASDDQQ